MIKNYLTFGPLRALREGVDIELIIIQKFKKTAPSDTDGRDFRHVTTPYKSQATVVSNFVSFAASIA